MFNIDDFAFDADDFFKKLNISHEKTVLESLILKSRLKSIKNKLPFRNENDETNNDFSENDVIQNNDYQFDSTEFDDELSDASDDEKNNEFAKFNFR